MSGAMVSDRRLYLAADEQTLVEDGDPRSRFLLCTRGGDIPADQVRRLGLELVDGKVQQRVPAGSSKEAEKSEDKQKPAPENKGKK